MNQKLKDKIQESKAILEARAFEESQNAFPNPDPYRQGGDISLDNMAEALRSYYNYEPRPITIQTGRGGMDAINQAIQQSANMNYFTEAERAQQTLNDMLGIPQSRMEDEGFRDMQRQAIDYNRVQNGFYNTLVTHTTTLRPEERDTFAQMLIADRGIMNPVRELWEQMHPLQRNEIQNIENNLNT